MTLAKHARRNLQCLSMTVKSGQKKRRVAQRQSVLIVSAFEINGSDPVKSEPATLERGSISKLNAELTMVRRHT